MAIRPTGRYRVAVLVAAGLTIVGCGDDTVPSGQSPTSGIEMTTNPTTVDSTTGDSTTNPPVATDGNATPTGPVAFTEIAEFPHIEAPGGLPGDTPGVVLAADQAALDAAWGDWSPKSRPPEPTPPVTNASALLVWGGESASGLTLTKVTKRDGAYVVAVDIARPAEGCGVAAVVGGPVVIVSVPAGANAAELQVTPTVARC